MYRSIFTVFLFGFLYVNNSFAVDIAKCEDQSGEESYRDYCPPDMKQVGEKKIPTKKHTRPNITPTVYMAPKDAACDAVLRFFRSKKIAVDEKNIDGNLELQNELKGLVGDLKIPTIIIGSKVLTDYKPDELTSTLMELGFTDDDLKEEEPSP